MQDEEDLYSDIVTRPERRGRQNQRVAFGEVREKLIDNALANLEARFPRSDLLEAMQVLEIMLTYS